jgi:hypothetical protein
VGDAGAAALAGAPLLAGLTDLDLGRNAFGAEGALALAATKQRPVLKRFTADFNEIADRGCVALLRSPLLRQIEDLRLSTTDIGDEVLRVLAHRKRLGSLKTFFAPANRFTADGIAAFAGAPHLAGLSVLAINNNSLGDGGGLALARSRYLTRLTHVDLAETGITDKTLLALARSPNVSGLKTLDIGYNPDISDKGLLALAGSRYLRNLEKLDISYTAARDKGVLALKRSARLPKVSLSTLGCKLSEETRWEPTRAGRVRCG